MLNLYPWKGSISSRFIFTLEYTPCSRFSIFSSGYLHVNLLPGMTNKENLAVTSSCEVWAISIDHTLRLFETCSTFLVYHILTRGEVEDPR